MKGRKLYWALKARNGVYMSWLFCAASGIPLPLTTLLVQNVALFETRQQARTVAGKLQAKGYDAVRVRCDIVEVL